MKKIISILAVVALMAVLATVAFAAEETALVVDTVEAAPGEEVVVNISIVNNPGFVLGEGTIEIDATGLEVVSYELVGMEDWQWKTSEIMENGYFLIFADAIKDYTLTGDCVLMKVTLKVKEDAKPGSYFVKVNVVDIGDDAESFIFEQTFEGAVVIPCTNHVWDDGVVTKEPTCVETGVMLYTCTICGETKEETIPTVDHTWGEWEVTTAASCGVEGVETRTCSVCGETETRAVAALEHNWVETERVEPTGCTDGKVVYTCSICGETKEEVLPASGEHTWAETERVEATCCDNGKVVYTCSVCGETKEDVLPATGEHALTYVAIDDKDHKIICANTNKELGVEAHTFGEWIEDTENPGWKYQLCEKCLHKLIDESGKTGDNSVVAVAMATLSMLGIAVVVSKKKEF